MERRVDLNKLNERPENHAGYTLAEKPWYLPLADEVDIFMAAYDQRLPVLLKGPTGCGNPVIPEIAKPKPRKRKALSGGLSGIW